MADGPDPAGHPAGPDPANPEPTPEPAGRRELRRRLLVEPRRPRRIREYPQAHWLAVGAVCVGAFMGQLDASIVTLALPSLQHDFRASLGGVTWVGLSYLVTLVALVVAVGRLADMTGRKLLYTYGFVVFIAGSAFCGLAPTLGVLIGFRVLQAVGAAMLQANSVAIVYLAMPPERLGRGLGVQGAAQALGLALGPTVGGLLIALSGWRLVFLVNVPFGVVGAVLGWAFIPRSRELQARVRFDWPALVLLAPAVAAGLWALSFGDNRGWTSAATVTALVAAAVLAALFVARERRVRDPMVDLTLFRRPQFSAGVASGLLSYLVMFGVLFVVPFLLERGRGLGAGRTGLVVSAMPLALGVVAPLAGRLADRVGARPVTVAGMVVTAALLAVLAAAHSGPVPVAAGLAGVGVGLGLFVPANNAAIMAAAPRAQSGLASGLLNMTRGVGTALGLAVTSLVFGLAARGVDRAGGPAGSGADHGFTVAVLLLSGLAALSAALAAMRGRVAPAPVPSGQLQL